MFDFNLNEIASHLESGLLEKARSMETIADPKELDSPLAKIVDVGEQTDGTNASNELLGNLNPYSVYEVDGNTYETDGQGEVYKTNGELNPNTEYTLKAITYRTDELGRIKDWEGKPGYNPDAERDQGAQTEAGGKDRQEGDDGGHLIARILDGSSGNENMVAMRDTLNRGDYKRTENELAAATNPDSGIEDIHDSGKLIYEGESSRPTKIERTYIIDGIKKEFTGDNVEGSQDLLEKVKDDVSKDDFDNLKNRIEDMEEDGATVSVVSVLKEYDKTENLVSVTVDLSDSEGTKSYIKLNAV